MSHKNEPRPPAPPVTSAHAIRVGVSVGLCVAIAGLAVSFFASRLWGDNSWLIGIDVWYPLQAAGFVANGALGYMYSATEALRENFIAMPGYPMLLAPVGLARDAFGLVAPIPMPLAQPSIWLVYGPYAFLLCSILFVGAQRLVDTARDGWRDSAEPPWVALALTPLVFVPVAFIYGHFEDVIALGFLMLACSMLVEGRWRQAAVWIAGALLLKQWAILFVPFLFVWTPVPQRWRALIISLGPAAILVTFVLAVDWTHASEALFRAPTFPSVGHAALWTDTTATEVLGHPTRIAPVIISIVIALLLRRERPTVALVSAALAVTLLSRVFFESVAFSYYLAPALAFAAVHAWVTTRRIYWTLGFGTIALLWFSIHPNRVLWWVVFTLACIPVFAACVVTVWHKHSFVIPHLPEPHNA